MKHKSSNNKKQKTMKKLILLLLVGVSLFTFTGCGPDNGTATEKAKVEVSKDLRSVLTAQELAAFDAQNIVFQGEEATKSSNAKGGGNKKNSASVPATPVSATLSDGGTSMTWTMNSAPAEGQVFVYIFIRRGDSTSTVSGNVYPTSVRSLYYPNTTTTTSYDYFAGSGSYQLLVVTGSLERDENGVLGANWVWTYSNVLNKSL